jgi:hypothetical protein
MTEKSLENQENFDIDGTHCVPNAIIFNIVNKKL